MAVANKMCRMNYDGKGKCIHAVNVTVKVPFSGQAFIAYIEPLVPYDEPKINARSKYWKSFVEVSLLNCILGDGWSSVHLQNSQTIRRVLGLVKIVFYTEVLHYATTAMAR